MKLTDRLKLKGGKIVYNTLNMDINSNLKDYIYDLTQDMLQIIFEDPNIVIDAGWSDEISLAGYFTVYIIKDYDWDNPYRVFRVKNLPDLLKALQRSIDEVERLIQK